MMKIRKHLLVGMMALSMGAGSFAVHAAGPDGGAYPDYAKSEGHMKEGFEKRQKELHAQLKLTPNQEGAWNKFISGMKAGTPATRPDREKMASMTAPERMDALLARMKEMEARMTERAAAVKEFYAVLTPEQQKIFNDHFAKTEAHHHRAHR